MFTEQADEGLDRAIMTMKRGEQAIVTVSSGHFHGNDASRNANEQLFYEVQLIDFIKVLCSCSSYSTCTGKMKQQTLLKSRV